MTSESRSTFSALRAPLARLLLLCLLFTLQAKANMIIAMVFGPCTDGTFAYVNIAHLNCYSEAECDNGTSPSSTLWANWGCSLHFPYEGEVHNGQVSSNIVGGTGVVQGPLCDVCDVYTYSDCNGNSTDEMQCFWNCGDCYAGR